MIANSHSRIAYPPPPVRVKAPRSAPPSSPHQRGGVGVIPLLDFVQGTKIKTPQEEGAASVPFDLWPAQHGVLSHMERDPLLVILKARQLGISWLACGYILWLCTQHHGKTALLFSQGQLEANDLIERISFMYYEHREKDRLPRLIRENTQELVWEGGSGVRSLPATKKAGRSFTASIVMFDEFAFMLFGASLYAAAKPTIDDGGKLWIISSADGQGTAYHQFWQAAQAGANGFRPIFLDWRARPSRDDGWRDRKLIEAYGDTAMVLREYPANDIEAFTHAAGLVYDVWADGPEGGNVTETADFIQGGGEILWAIDDGYEGRLNPATGTYTDKSAPRVFLLVQVRADGRLCVFQEHYAVKVLQEEHIRQVVALGYPEPEYAVVDSAAAELRGRLLDSGVATFGKPGSIEESIKTTRRMLAPDQNGWRRVLVHPRCKQLRSEFASYRRGENGAPIDAFNHGLDALRYLCWKMRLE